MIQNSHVVEKWCDFRPSMSEFVLRIYPSKVHTHREHTPGAVGSHLCCSTQGAFEGLVPCLRALRGIEGGESAVHSLPPPTIPAGPRLEPATFRLRVWLSTFKLPQNVARLMQISCRLHNYNNRLKKPWVIWLWFDFETQAHKVYAANKLPKIPFIEIVKHKT